MKIPPAGVRFQRKNTEQYHVCVGAPGISRSDRRRFAASLLDGILGGSASSRLFQEIREKRGMAYAVYSFGAQYSDTGLFGVYVGTREENLAPCLEIVAEQIADVAAGNFRAGELDRAKENLKGRITLSMESTSNRMSRLGKSLITDTELLSFERIIAEIDAVEPEGVAELASASCSRPSGSRPPGSARARRGSSARSAACTRAPRPRRGVKVALFGARGKVGSALAPGARGGGPRGDAGSRRRPDLAAHDAAIDFTWADVLAENVTRCIEAGVPCIVGTTGATSPPLGTLARERASRSSTRRTSRSARC